MTNAELLAKIKAEIERRITDNTFGAKLELIDILAWLSTLESEKPINPEAAMKELDEKIALVKRRGTWDGVDVDKYMDEVRGREPEKPIDLVEEVKRYYSDNFAYLSSDQPTLSILTNIARHFAEWQKEQTEKRWLEDRDGCFWDGVEEGKKAMKEQMMKEAVEGKVCGINGNWVESEYLKNPVGEEGDKVKLIIIKED